MENEAVDVPMHVEVSMELMVAEPKAAEVGGSEYGTANCSASLELVSGLKSDLDTHSHSEGESEAPNGAGVAGCVCESLGPSISCLSKIGSVSSQGDATERGEATWMSTWVEFR